MVFDALIGVVQAAGDAAQGYLASRPALGALIRAGNAEGKSGAAILREFRLAGGRVANGTFYALRGSVLAAQQAHDDVRALMAGDTSAVVKLDGGRAGSYRLDWRVYQQFTDDLGNVVRRYQQFSSGQRDLDVNQAMQDFQDIYNENIADEEYGGKLLGFELTNIYQYTG